MRIRVFISSPGDVAEERDIAQEAIEQRLPKDPLLRGTLDCEAVRWDDRAAPVPLPAFVSPQEAVNLGLGMPSQCDVVIVILWARFGTPLNEPLRPDGTQYLSGTEWEFEDAMSATPRPHILVYRRTSDPPWKFNDPTIRDKLDQMQRVEEFFKRFGSGPVPGIYTRYETPQALGERLLSDLRAYVRQRQLQPEPLSEPGLDIPPYGDIARAMLRGTVIPFIGPGACASGRPPKAVWDPSKPAFLPSGVELSHLLAEEADFPSEDACSGLPAVASYYATLKTRGSLRERLRQILASLQPKNEIPPLYRCLAAIPGPLLIITANFDTKIEQAFRDAGRHYDLVVYPADRKDLANALLWWPHGSVEPRTPAPNDLDIDLKTTTVIFKMYGSYSERDEWNGFVITEDDYVTFFSRLSGKSAIPTLFTTHFRERSLLLLGYGLRDWPLRVVIGSLSRFFARSQSEEGEELQSWAIARELSALERRLWPRLGVVPFRVDLDAFAEELCRRIGP